MQANFLTKYASVVYLVHRRNSFRASKIMQARVQDNPKIQVRACRACAYWSVVPMPHVIQHLTQEGPPPICWMARGNYLCSFS